MRKQKSIRFMIFLSLFVLAAIAAYRSIQNLSALLPADSYKDEGVHTFSPYQVLPIQVKNTSTSRRGRRINRTKTIYKIYYKATDGSGYQWSDETPAKTIGQKAVDAKATVRRRVLRIPANRTYITVEPGLTPESYTAGQKKKNLQILGISTAYILLYLPICLFLYIRRRKQRHASSA